MTEYIAILPDAVDASAHTYLRLPHPRTGAPQLYLPTPTSICEVSKVSGAQGRTWFIGDSVSHGAMLLHHPIDPLFLAIPLALSLIPTGRTAPFQPLGDLLSSVVASSAWDLKPAFAPSAPPTAADIARLVEIKAFRKAFRACCERKVIEAADDSGEGVDEAEGSRPRSTAYYRSSREVILELLRRKVDRLADEANFSKFDHLVRGLGRDGLLETGADPVLVQAARNTAAIEHIAQYLPPLLLPMLIASYDMAAYNRYLQDRSAAARAAEAPIIVEKKEKENKRKLAKTESSRGVEALKKVNTNGMAKMTSFFKPKTK
ncbi:hypothetical protein CC85DRAFT_288554 [Cutaneotrichosporon oleaginosum]|uniref:Rnh202 triple barrel domain-containing protein n=1 Tax=Cutaneotrichosporon oleaginosum TaxID=879819 RepID=A0A0J0XEF1_9TREE|nr:uncharacterized protein CC85DRAFT_288554 [Cutaneotrichosporon oleaginosum]KLT39432.1 hypothetical protein CC85DRAFT_288554 [Cutaneotrichosporon oleaginosum]TXT08438.1 hypothetical protein COLE_05362 [Cutaneotrichosporon oleaginosum]